MYAKDFKLPKLVGKRPVTGYPKIRVANGGKYGCRLPPLVPEQLPQKEEKSIPFCGKRIGATRLLEESEDIAAQQGGKDSADSSLDWLYKIIGHSSSKSSSSFDDDTTDSFSKFLAIAILYERWTKLIISIIIMIINPHYLASGNAINQFNDTNTIGIKQGLVHSDNLLVHKVIIVKLNFSSTRKKINQTKKSQPLSLPVQVIDEVEIFCPGNKKQIRKLK